MIIKVLLLASLGSAGLFVLRGHRSALNLLVRRALTLGAIACGGLAVLFPSAVTRTAELVGVGRGTDLVLYVLCVAFLFVSTSLYTRHTDMHDRFVELTRQQALLEAELVGLREVLADASDRHVSSQQSGQH
ncbi:hypothetical protein FB382_002284 [Nocardioides ginsengisegetis]|uniref:DUF2304 domain-containing protein n=1 Tax=Nocardioides ginsengisegetis TaxID=661491 RepID=A0A7W3J0D5_9ACTN|nr:DUF2304 domain-containing protein [Nocardioides ginsengisegetis]MBA8803993.1 hypothetical protein [Nocardioides ginsengisegetis]